MGNYPPPLSSPSATLPKAGRCLSHASTESHGSHHLGCLVSRLGRSVGSPLHPRGSLLPLGCLAPCVDPFALGEADEENRRNDRHQTHPEKAPPHQEVFVKLRQYEVGVRGLFLSTDLTVCPVSLHAAWRCSSRAVVSPTLQA